MAPTPAPTLSAFDKLLEEGVEQDLDALGDQAADLGFDLGAVLDGGPLFAANAGEEEEEFTGPDFLADLLVGFDDVPEEPTPAPTPAATSLADLVDLGDLFGDFEEEEEVEPVDEQEAIDMTPPRLRLQQSSGCRDEHFHANQVRGPVCTLHGWQRPAARCKGGVLQARQNRAICVGDCSLGQIKRMSTGFGTPRKLSAKTWS